MGLRIDTMRAFLFVVFFSIGAAAMCGAILLDDVLSYHHNKQLLKTTEISLKRLESLITDYDALLQQLEKDPNLINRIGPAVLGTEPAEANAVYPKVTAQQLDAARQALTEDMNQQTTEPELSNWLARCSKPPQRIVLFSAGAFLILVSFVWFGPTGRQKPEKQRTDDRTRTKSPACPSEPEAK